MRRRILLTTLGLTAFAVLAFFIPAALAVRSRVQRSELLELQREASIVASRIGASGPIDMDEVNAAIDSSHDIAVYLPDGTKTDGVGPERADAVVHVGLEGTFAEGDVAGDLVAAVPVRMTAAGPGLVVRIIEPGSESDQRVRESVALLAAAAVGVLLVAGVIGVLLARRLSRPVEDLRTWAADLGRHADAAAPGPTGIAELDDLGVSLNEAGERIRELLQRERSFSSHVSHQLRTPVAAMRVAVEAELDAPRPDRATVLIECLRALDRLESTIESMLALARHDGREPSWCDVAALVREHSDRWRPSYAAAGRDIDVDAGTHVGQVDSIAVSHILDVLLDNALVHGRGRVVVAVRRSSGVLNIDVRDAGPARPDADPFSERRADSGHGIGLRLARTLAESEGGHLSLLDEDPTVFRLTLPTPV
ncbi:MAG: HAMP domain-containing sensor histidine kinase [Ilumatobacteraceae bacterium]